MSTQAWGFRALMGCGRKAPSPPKGGKVGVMLESHPPSWPLIFWLLRREVKRVPHCPLPWCEAHAVSGPGLEKPTYSEGSLLSWWYY